MSRWMLKTGSSSPPEDICRKVDNLLGSDEGIYAVVYYSGAGKSMVPSCDLATVRSLGDSHPPSMRYSAVLGVFGIGHDGNRDPWLGGRKTNWSVSNA